MTELLADIILTEDQKSIIESTAEKILKSLGVQPRLKGVRYIIAAVLMLIQSPRIPMTKPNGVYPTIARMYGVKMNSVERCMRYVIEELFLKGNMERIIELCGYIDPDKMSMTVSSFLCYLAKETYLHCTGSSERIV